MPRLRSRSRLRSAFVPVAALVPVAASACGSEPPALTAAGLTFSERDLLGLSTDRRLHLGELAAFGVAVADDRLAELGEPRVEVLRRDRAWQMLEASRILDSAGVDDEVLRARYLTAPAWELTVRHLLVMSPRYETDATRAAAREKAGRALERIRAGEPFPAVAAEVSEEPGAEGRQGLLTPGREGSWVDEFWMAALALDTGEVSGVVETEYGFHVLRLEDRRVVPFDEAGPALALEVAGMMAELPRDAASAPLPEGFAIEEGAAELVADADAEGSVDVATWSGGSLTLDTLRRALAGAPPGGPAAADPAEAIARVARSVAAARRAARAGLEPDPGWEEETRRAWLLGAEEWAGLLGFRTGMSMERVRETALAAFEASGQNVSIAREEVRREAARLLHHAYRIETPAADGA